MPGTTLPATPTERGLIEGTILWGKWPVSDSIARMVDRASDAEGVPRNVTRAIVIGESAVGLGGKVEPYAVGDNGASVGLLQLHERGQGAGMSAEDRRDPAKNLARGMPPIGKAWRATSHLPYNRSRMLRVAALSQHPGDPDAHDVGSQPYTVAVDGTERIATVWAELEGWEPSIVPGGTFGLSNDGLRRASDEMMQLVREHPIAAIGAAVGVVVLLAK